MNSISRNKYIDKSATPLKAYFTLASARERAQTTYAPARVRTHTHVQAGRHLAAREKEEEEKERERVRLSGRAKRAGVLIEEWFAPSIKNLVCFWPTDIEEKLFASGI